MGMTEVILEQKGQKYQSSFQLHELTWYQC